MPFFIPAWPQEMRPHEAIRHRTVHRLPVHSRRSFHHRLGTTRQIRLRPRAASSDSFPKFEDVAKDHDKVISSADGKSGMYTLYRDKDGHSRGTRTQLRKAEGFIAYTIKGGIPTAGVQYGDMYAYWKRFGVDLHSFSPTSRRGHPAMPSHEVVGEGVYTDRVILDVPIVTMDPAADRSSISAICSSTVQAHSSVELPRRFEHEARQDREGQVLPEQCGTCIRNAAFKRSVRHDLLLHRRDPGKHRVQARVKPTNASATSSPATVTSAIPLPKRSANGTSTATATCRRPIRRCR